MRQRHNSSGVLSAVINGENIESLKEFLTNKQNYLIFSFLFFVMNDIVRDNVAGSNVAGGIKGYKEEFIKNLSNEDVKVAVSGIVIEKKENGILLDDGSGCLPVEIETDIEEGKFVRVFGFLVWDGSRVEMKGNIVQDISYVDRGIYDSVKKLMSKNT